MEGVKYISNPRPNRRGGGAAITLIEGDFSLTKLDVSVPGSLEVVMDCPPRPASALQSPADCQTESSSWPTSRDVPVRPIALWLTTPVAP